MTSTREQIKTIMAALEATYGKRLFPGELSPTELSAKVDLWHKLLMDLPFDVLQAVTIQWCQLNRYPPTIADLREGAMVKDGLTAADAWQLVMTAVADYGYYRQQAGLATLPDEVRHVVDTFGFEYYCTMPEDELRIAFAQFRDAYNIQIKRKQKQEQTNPQIAAMITRALEDRKMKCIEGEKNYASLE